MTTTLVVVINEEDEVLADFWLGGARLLTRCLSPYREANNVDTLVCVTPVGMAKRLGNVLDGLPVLTVPAELLNGYRGNLYAHVLGQSIVADASPTAVGFARPVLPFLTATTIERVVRDACVSGVDVATAYSPSVAQLYAQPPVVTEIHGCRVLGSTALAEFKNGAAQLRPVARYIEVSLIESLYVWDAEQRRIIEALDHY